MRRLEETKRDESSLEKNNQHLFFKTSQKVLKFFKKPQVGRRLDKYSACSLFSPTKKRGPAVQDS